MVDPKRWRSLLTQACRIRGSVYLQDGAIRPEDLNANGAFWLPMDETSWHLLTVNDDDEVTATLRVTMLPLDAKKRKGKLPHVGASLSRASRDTLSPRLTTERFLSSLWLEYGAERNHFLVVGGWAASPTASAAGVGAELALSVWAFTRHVEAAGAICVASERHDAHGQLVRTGAVPIRAIGAQVMYYDSAYGCQVGLLGFKVFKERRALKRVVDHLATKITSSEVVMSTAIE